MFHPQSVLNVGSGPSLTKDDLPIKNSTVEPASPPGAISEESPATGMMDLPREIRHKIFQLVIRKNEVVSCHMDKYHLRCGFIEPGTQVTDTAVPDAHSVMLTCKEFAYAMGMIAYEEQTYMFPVDNLRSGSDGISLLHLQAVMRASKRSFNTLSSSQTDKVTRNGLAHVQFPLGLAYKYDNAGYPLVYESKIYDLAITLKELDTSDGQFPITLTTDLAYLPKKIRRRIRYFAYFYRKLSKQRTAALRIVHRGAQGPLPQRHLWLSWNRAEQGSDCPRERVLYDSSVSEDSLHDIHEYYSLNWPASYGLEDSILRRMPRTLTRSRYRGRQ